MGAIVVLAVVLVAGQVLTVQRADLVPPPKGSGTTDMLEVLRDLEGTWDLEPDAQAGTGLRFVLPRRRRGR